MESALANERVFMQTEICAIVARDTTFMQEGFFPTSVERLGGGWAIVCTTIAAEKK